MCTGIAACVAFLHIPVSDLKFSIIRLIDDFNQPYTPNFCTILISVFLIGPFHLIF